jgi:hypothetical protein
MGTAILSSYENLGASFRRDQREKIGPLSFDARSDFEPHFRLGLHEVIDVTAANPLGDRIRRAGCGKVCGHSSRYDMPGDAYWSPSRRWRPERSLGLIAAFALIGGTVSSGQQHANSAAPNQVFYGGDENAKDLTALAVQRTSPADLIVVGPLVLKVPLTLYVHDLVFKQSGRVVLKENNLSLYITGQIRVDSPTTPYQILGFSDADKPPDFPNTGNGGNAGQSGMNGSPGGTGLPGSVGVDGKPPGTLFIQFVNRECATLSALNFRLRLDGQPGGSGGNGGNGGAGGNGLKGETASSGLFGCNHGGGNGGNGGAGGAGGSGGCGGNGGDGGLVRIICNRLPPNQAEWVRRRVPGYEDGLGGTPGTPGKSGTGGPGGQGGQGGDGSGFCNGGHPGTPGPAGPTLSPPNCTAKPGQKGRIQIESGVR